MMMCSVNQIVLFYLKFFEKKALALVCVCSKACDTNDCPQNK